MRRAHNRVVPEEFYSGETIAHKEREHAFCARMAFLEPIYIFFYARILVRLCLNESCLLTLD